VKKVLKSVSKKTASNAFQRPEETCRPVKGKVRDLGKTRLDGRREGLRPPIYLARLVYTESDRLA